MATYKIKGDRFVRMYRAALSTPAYSAPLDAATIAEELCNCEWIPTSVRNGGFPAHSGNEKTDQQNIASRELFDAYEFCAEHKDGMHRAYAGACFYRFRLPSAAVGKQLISIKASITCDPYNAHGARISINTGASAILPTQCATCRNGASSDTSSTAQSNNASGDAPATEWTSTNTHVEGVAPRREVINGNTTTWYPTSGTAVIAPAGGLVLERYIYVFVGLENYNYARQGYLEGAASCSPTLEISLSTAIDGVSDGSTIDCASGEGVDRVIVTHLPDNSLYYDGTVQTGQFSRVFASRDFLFAVGSNPENAKSMLGMYIFNVSADNPGPIKYSDIRGPDLSANTSPTEAEFDAWIKRPIVKALMMASDITGIYATKSVPSTKKSKGSAYIYLTTHDATKRLAFINKIYDAENPIFNVTYDDTEENSIPYYADSDGGDLLVVKDLGEGRGIMLPVTLGASDITVPKLGTLAFDGVATGIGQYIATESGRFCLAGNFRSVGGVPVRNCCIIDMRSGGFRVIPLDFDTQISPDSYDGFRLVATSTNSYHFTGCFTRLGAVDCPVGSASVDAAGVVTADDAHYIDIAGAAGHELRIRANVTTT